MRIPIKILLYFLLITALYEDTHPQSVYVPLNYPVYDFIERFEAKGTLRRVLNSTKPLSRNETAELLLKIRTGYESGEILSEVELEQLKYYEKEFKEELQDLGYISEIREIEFTGLSANLKKRVPEFIYSNGRNLLEVKKEDFSVFADLVLHRGKSFTDSSTSGMRDDLLRYTSGIRIRGNIGEKFGFFADARNTKEWGSREYPRGEDISGIGLGWVNNF
ncbi:MAG: hypothetical protein GY863_08380, partial [bacterium]|nr:hypothetical protein [bacterium]